LTLAELRGKVVIIDFWTYSCVNCVRTLPYLTDWYGKYADDGLVIIGVHAPEFAFEEETSNVIDATNRFGIEYPVAQDNDFNTWRAYNNRYWPAKYFIDTEGNVRYTHFGEGEYEKSELVIQQLLAEIGTVTKAALTDTIDKSYSASQTPELYVGFQRQTNFATPGQLVRNQASQYTLPQEIPLHLFAVSGEWTFNNEYARVEKSGAQLELHFNAKDVFLVLDSAGAGSVSVELLISDKKNLSADLDENNMIIIDEARLYHLVELDEFVEGRLLLTFNSPGLEAYAFTFGS